MAAWPYCPSCLSLRGASISVVRNGSGNPVGYACSACAHWWRLEAFVGDATVDSLMAPYGVEFHPESTVVQDPALGSRRSCGYTCDLVLRNGAASCSCGLDGLA